MKKTILLPSIGTGTAAIGLGVGLASGLNSYNDPGEVTLVSYEEETEKALEILKGFSGAPSKDADKVASDYLSFPCTKYIFGDKKWEHDNKLDSGLRVKASEKEKDKYLELNGEGRVTGCLDVWWEKRFFNNQWKGKFNLVWAVSDGKNAVILTNTAWTYRGGLIVGGNGYILEKKKSKWKSVGAQYTSGLRVFKVNQENWKQSIIKAGPAVESTENEWWGFNVVWGNICWRDDYCANETKNRQSSNQSWIFERDDKNGKPLKEWTSNMEEWSNDTYGTLFSTNRLDMYKNIKGKFKLLNPQ